MNTVVSKFESDYRIKSSKFLGFLNPASTVNEAEKQIEWIQNEHPTATHYCYAYLLNPNKPIEYVSDDGEPSGTAGLPILNALKSFNMMNTVLIVTRYFGGTKLGKAGLIDAYQTSATQCLKSANLKTLIPVRIYQIEYDYSQQSLIEKWKRMFHWIELESTYLETVQLTVGCPKAESSTFEDTINSMEYRLINFDDRGESFHIKN